MRPNPPIVGLVGETEPIGCLDLPLWNAAYTSRQTNASRRRTPLLFPSTCHQVAASKMSSTQTPECPCLKGLKAVAFFFCFDSPPHMNTKLVSDPPLPQQGFPALRTNLRPSLYGQITSVNVLRGPLWLCANFEKSAPPHTNAKFTGHAA